MAFHHTQTEEFREIHMPKPKDKKQAVEQQMTMAEKVSLYKKRTARNNNEDW